MLYNVQLFYVIQKGASWLSDLILNYQELASVILFAIGFTMLVFSRNIIKKIMGLNIMDTGVYLFLATMGYIDSTISPIVPAVGEVDPSAYTNPIPQGLVLTGIVVSVSVSALMLALSIRLYQNYRTLDLDKIYAICHKEEEENA